MKLKIKKLILENFKRFIKEEIEFQNITNIYAINEAGKTTILDAFRWLFFGKHSKGKTDLDIKTKCTKYTQSYFPKNKIGDVIHNLKHSVTAIIDIDGREIELKKVFSESWGVTAKIKKKHLKTHTTKHWFDGRSMPEKDYKEEISNIVDEKIFRMLTEPEYFPSIIHWSERRSILKEMSGNIKRTDINGYESIKTMIQNCTAEQKIKALKDELKLIKDERDNIPVQIKECQGFVIEIQDYTGPEYSDLIQKKLDTQDKINFLKSKSGQNQKLAEIQVKITQFVNNFNIDKARKIGGISEQVRKLNSDLLSIENLISDYEDDLENSKSILENKENEIKMVFNDWEKATTSKPDFRPCSNCGFIEDEVNIRNNFNIEKSKNIEQIEKKGNVLRELIDNLKEKIKTLPDTIQSEQFQVNEIKEKIKILKNQYKDIENTKPDLSELEARKAEIAKNIQEKKPVDTSDLENQIIKIDNQISSINQINLDIKKNKEYQDRISDLENLETELSQKIADLEKRINLLLDFINSEIELVEKSVNDLFEFTTFKMFHQNISDGVREICEAVNDGILYPSVNNAGRIQSGIDIIKQLQRHYNIELPVFIDNRESVTNIPQADCQIVSFYVSSSNKKLRIEYGK